MKRAKDDTAKRKAKTTDRDEGGSAGIQPSGDMTIYTVAEIKGHLLKALRGDMKAINLDLSVVGEFDTAGLQLLMALKREADAIGKSFRIVRHSSVTSAVFRTYNIGGYFSNRTAARRHGNKEARA